MPIFRRRRRGRRRRKRGGGKFFKFIGRAAKGLVKVGGALVKSQLGLPDPVHDQPVPVHTTDVFRQPVKQPIIKTSTRQKSVPAQENKEPWYKQTWVWAAVGGVVSILGLTLAFSSGSGKKRGKYKKR